MNIIDELEQRARVTAHVKLDRKTMLAILAVVRAAKEVTAAGRSGRDEAIDDLAETIAALSPLDGEKT